MATALERVLQVLLPRSCVHCREDLEAGSPEPLCPPCDEALPRIEGLACLRCGLPVDGGAHCPACRGRRFRCERIRAPFAYSGPAASLLKAFKYGGRRSLARPLGGWMALRLAGLPGLRTRVLVPVPLHPRRLRERGFDQAQLLAEELGRRLGLPVRPLLRRVRHAPPQAALGRSERAVNLEGAYEAVRPLSGRCLLVDDVATTGATLEACADALKKAGARRVAALVAARSGAIPGASWHRRPRAV